MSVKKIEVSGREHTLILIATTIFPQYLYLQTLTSFVLLQILRVILLENTLGKQLHLAIHLQSYLHQALIVLNDYQLWHLQVGHSGSLWLLWHDKAGVVCQLKESSKTKECQTDKLHKDSPIQSFWPLNAWAQQAVFAKERPVT